MRVSYEWLKDYVDLTGIAPEDIAEEMNRTGIEVDVIYTRDAGVTNVVVGQVLSVVRHPEADRLKVCKVHVGDRQPLQIVCGANNVAAGQLVPVALEGATLPGGVTIRKTVLRGVESQGMICSAKELGFPDKFLMKEQQEGILVLGKDAVIGQDIKEYLGMNDQVLELELTPNRSDCLSMLGVAYEVSAIFDRKLRLPEIELHEIDSSEVMDIIIESEEDCPIYSAQIVRNLKIGPSPQWMQNRLISAGIRPINNVVDITNYVMIETGQPLHAFDLDTLKSREIIVRRSRQGEQIVTLDGVTRELDDETLLISDGQQILGIAGIMGGQSSEVTEKTTNVLIESAFFDPTLIRKASKKLGLRTEASNRFEKGVDPGRTIPALQRCVQLLVEIAGGELASDVICEDMGDIDDMEIQLRHERIGKLLGVQLNPDEVLNIFRRLHFPARFENSIYYVQVPSRRSDVMTEIDLIEEIARLYGYERIPAAKLSGQQPMGKLTRAQKMRRMIRRTLSQLGLHEVITYSLTSHERNQEIASLHQGVTPIAVAMPMSNEHSVLRTTLLPQLIQTAVYNQNHGIEDVAIFEIAHTYLTEETHLSHLPEERYELAFLLTGNYRPTQWNQPAVKGGDFFIGKGIVEALFSTLGVVNVEYKPAAYTGFHPGRTAEIRIGEEVVGVLGELHPKLAKQYDLGNTVLCQLDLEKLAGKLNHEIRYESLVRYPSVTRDLAVVVDHDLPVGEIEAGIRKAAGELLESITLFDVFTGEQIGEGKKSVAFSLVYRAKDRTLTDEEVQTAHQQVIDTLEQTLGAKLRQ